MRRPEMIEGLRMLKFGKIHERYDGDELTQAEAPEAQAGEIARLYREKCAGFTAKHVREPWHEHLVQGGFKWSYTWTKSLLQRRNLLEVARARGAHRRKRPRRPMAGMMLHQDASRHVWVAGAPACDLVVTLDLSLPPRRRGMRRVRSTRRC